MIKTSFIKIYGDTPFKIWDNRDSVIIYLKHVATCLFINCTTMQNESPRARLKIYLATGQHCFTSLKKYAFIYVCCQTN